MTSRGSLREARLGRCRRHSRSHRPRGCTYEDPPSERRGEPHRPDAPNPGSEPRGSARRRHHPPTNRIQRLPSSVAGGLASARLGSSSSTASTSRSLTPPRTPAGCPPVGEPRTAARWRLDARASGGTTATSTPSRRSSASPPSPRTPRPRSTPRKGRRWRRPCSGICRDCPRPSARCCTRRRTSRSSPSRTESAPCPSRSTCSSTTPRWSPTSSTTTSPRETSSLGIRRTGGWARARRCTSSSSPRSCAPSCSPRPRSSQRPPLSTCCTATCWRIRTTSTCAGAKGPSRRRSSRRG